MTILSSYDESLSADYTNIEKLSGDIHTAVYRAFHTQKKQTVVIKVVCHEQASVDSLTQFRNQYEIAKYLQHPAFVSNLSLERWGNRYALIMPEEGFIPLPSYWQQNTHTDDVVAALDIALQLADALHYLSSQRIIHKDIKPDNILIHPETSQIKLIDFSIACLLTKERKAFMDPGDLEGTLAYMAPEQTGRMNRGIDYRSDFYAFGITLYELLTGELPFSTEGETLDGSGYAIALIHSHLTTPLPIAHEINADIPPILSEILTKLTAKNAEDRYQSALGLKADLECCRSGYIQKGKEIWFPLGEGDKRERFLIPEKLYGRQREVQTLLAAFERVSQGKAEIMLVAGFSGIGKTAVISEIHKPITRQHGHFIQGKFDQFNRNIPFSAFIQAFRGLMTQLLSESDTAISQWKEQILTAVGDCGQVLIDVIPELELIIGPQPKVTELSGNAAQNRFNLLFGKFVRTFSTPEHPLVIFLDDLQWADAASLALLKRIVTEASTLEASETTEIDTDISLSVSLLVLGAYRDNETFAAHPLMLAIDELKGQGIEIDTLTLKPLNKTDINTLVADTLLCSPGIAQPLSELIYQKTQGNPFFTTQFLQGLHGESCITFNTALGHWECDLAKVRQLALTDDVVSFVVEQLKKLPPATQTTLKLAACIGNRFDLATLAVVCETSQDEVAAELWRSLQVGLVIPESENYKFFQSRKISNSAVQEESSTDSDAVETSPNLTVRYRFLHDRVQQAAYSLISEDQKQAIHLKIGQRLLQSSPEQDKSETFFAIVGQLNKGASLLESPNERHQLAQLNLKAGQKATEATAYAAAVEHFEQARQMLPADCWQNDYATALKLFVASLEAEYLSTNFAAIEPLAATILTNTQTVLDSISVHSVRIRAYIGQGDQHKALEIGLEVLALLGIALLEAPPNSASNIPALIDAPTTENPQILAAMDIMTGIITCAWAVNPRYFRRIAYTMVDLSLRYGNCPASSFGYAWYGTILCSYLGKIEVGYQFGRLAVDLLACFDTQVLQAKVLNIYATCIGCWQHHVRHCLPFHLDGLRSGLETGDLEFASYDAAEYAQYQFLMGLPLEQVQESCEQKLSIIQHLSQDFHVDYLAPWLQATLNLRGHRQSEVSSTEACATELEGTAYRESEKLDALIEQKQLTLVFVAYFAKSFLSYIFGDYKQALAHGQVARDHSAGVTGSLSIPTEMFYSSLAQLSCLDTMNTAEQKQAKINVESCLRKLQHRAIYAPDNFQHKCEILQAELARTNGNLMTAMNFYDQAITHARETEYIQEEAIANELAAKFYLSWGRERVAASYMQEAYDCYRRWGAQAKLEQMETTYSSLLLPALRNRRQSGSAASELSMLSTLSTQSSLRATLERTTFSSSTLSSSTLGTDTTLSQTKSRTNNVLDLITILQASQAISGIIDLEELLRQLTKILLQNSGGDRCAILLCNEQGALEVRAIATIQTIDLLDIPISNAHQLPSKLPIQLIRYVKHTSKTTVLESPASEIPVVDEYLFEQRPGSVLCLPLIDRTQLRGVLYLENQSTYGVFHPERLTPLNLLSTQAAIALENARLYQQAQAHAQQIKESQLQLVQSEKMSTLGNLVAGVAHEINNPIGFISGNIHAIDHALKDITECLNAYRKAYPDPNEDIDELLEDLQIDFLLSDMPKMLKSMDVGCQRLRSISKGLRTFSRADTESKFMANLHDGLESTLLILKYRLKSSDLRPAINIVRNYGDLPEISCFPGQLNQVFMNLLANAVDMFDEMAAEPTSKIEHLPPEIIIHSQQIKQDSIEILIEDNGKGMPEAIREKIFERTFTTKAVGKGTGLGLAIAHQIITETHGGTLTVKSTEGKGTTFIICLPTKAT